MENKDKILVIYDLDQLTKLQYKHIKYSLAAVVDLAKGCRGLCFKWSGQHFLCVCFLFVSGLWPRKPGFLKTWNCLNIL